MVKNILILFLLLLSAAAVLHYRQKEKRLFCRLQNMLDEAIAGTFRDRHLNETPESAFESSLWRYLCDNQAACRQAAVQKAQVQEIISDIAHQSMTPVSNIMLYAQLLGEEMQMAAEKERQPEQVQPAAEKSAQAARREAFLLEGISVITKQSEKLDFLIQSLAKLSRMETGMISVHPAKQCIQPVLDALKQQFGLKAAEKNIRFTVEDSSETAVFDCKWTIEAAANLTENAIKYTPQEGAVRIRVIPYALFVRIDISDSGIGIAQSEQAAVFRRFYRSAKVCQTQGLGIGLYLAREIIRAQKGYIKVSSEIGNGSTFSIFLLRKEMQNETLSQK